jgi:hypothetical protein
MTRVYKIAKGFRIAVYIIGPLMLAAFITSIVMLLLPDADGHRQTGLLYVLVPMCFILAPIVAVATYNTACGSIIIDQEKISWTGIPRRTLYFDQIKGYTTDPKGVINIVPHSREHRKIKLSAYTERLYEIVVWLQQHYPDLDKTHAAQVKDEALADARIGETEEQRAQKLTQQKMLTRILNWTGGFAAAWLVFKPVPYPLAALTCALIPLIVIALSRKFHGRMTISAEKEQTVFPDASAALGLPAAALAFRVFTDYHIYSFSQLWLPVLLAAGILLLVTISGAKTPTVNGRQRTIMITNLCFFYLAYSFGVLGIANCYLDNSQPQLFTASVLGKRSQKEKSRVDYLLKLSPWGPETESRETAVQRTLYEQADAGDTLMVKFRKGRIGVPWYLLEEGD